MKNQIPTYGPDAKKIPDTQGLLKEIVNCLNQVINKKVNNPFFRDTYEIITEIDKHIKSNENDHRK